MCPKNYVNLPFMWYKNLGGTFVRFVTIHACDGQTDGQTDTFAVRKTACILQRGKRGPFLKVHNSCIEYDAIGRCSMCQNVHHFISSMTCILNVATLKYSLHKFRETIGHRKYKLI